MPLEMLYTPSGIVIYCTPGLMQTTGHTSLILDILHICISFSLSISGNFHCVCAAVPSDYICTIAAVTVGTHGHAILDSLEVKLNTRVTFAWLHLDGSLCGSL